MSADITIEECVQFSVRNAHYVAFSDYQDTAVVGFSDRTLVTVIPILRDETSLIGFLKQYVERALAEDDVFCTAFLSGILLLCEHPYKDVDARELPASWRTSWVKFINKGDLAYPLSAGPYLLLHGTIRHVLRLYDDDNASFSIACRMKSNHEIIPLRIGSSEHNRNAVAVPSRLCFQESSPRPLNGVRITVKDIFDVKGFKTSLGSREYPKMRPPANVTSPAISRLVDAGCQMVGLSKMGSMVLKQEPTESIEFLAPFNPRADGWQSPSGGSSGQAAAIASYDWLDFAIGSDSTISGRMPAQANGCISLRPSVGAIPTTGMWSGVPDWDTPCLFGRDLTRFPEFVHAWYGEKVPTGHLKPLSLLYFDDFLPNGDPAQMQIFEGVIRDVESVSGLQAKRISIADSWKAHAPDAAESTALRDFLGPEVATCTYVYTFWQRFKPFWERYQEMFARNPYIPLPSGIDTWKQARHVTPSQHEKAKGRVEIYRRWLLDEMLEAEKNNPIVLIPLGNVEPIYRDAWPGVAGGDQMLWHPLLLSPILGAPELVIPCGEIPFSSKISGRREFLPVCVSMMGLPGSDLNLIDLALAALKKSGRLTKVQTGQRMFQDQVQD